MSGRSTDGCGAVSKLAQDDDKHKMDIYLRREMRLLQRDFRKLQDQGFGNHLSSFQCAHNLGTVCQLKEEKRQLLLLIHKCDDTKNNNHDNKKIDQIDSLLQIYQHEVTLVSECITSVKEISENVNHITNQIQKHQLKIQKIYGRQETLKHVTKRVNDLEKNLKFQTEKCNSTMADSASIRESIQGCLADRSFYFKRRRKYIDTLRNIKNQMASVTHKINLCFDKYDDAKSQIHHLIRQNEIDCHLFVNDIKESTRFLKNDRYICKFVDIKNKSRPSLEIEADRIKRRIQNIFENTRKLIPVYRHAFRLIADISETHDVEKTRQNYLEADHNNYVLFQFLIETENTIVNLKQEIEQLKQKIMATQESDADQRLDCLKKLKLEKDKHYQLNQEMQSWHQILNEKKGNMSKYVGEFQIIFQTAGADQMGVISMLGNSVGVTPKNIMAYLHILERRIVFLIRQKDMMMANLNRKKKYKNSVNRMLNNVSHRHNTGGPIRPSLIIPSGLDGKDDEEDDKMFSKRRFSYQELKAICRVIVQQSVDLIKALTVRSSESIIDAEESHHHLLKTLPAS